MRIPIVEHRDKGIAACMQICTQALAGLEIQACEDQGREALRKMDESQADAIIGAVGAFLMDKVLHEMMDLLSPRIRALADAAGKRGQAKAEAEADKP
jgi:hypothetical protein